MNSAWLMSCSRREQPARASNAHLSSLTEYVPGTWLRQVNGVALEIWQREDGWNGWSFYCGTVETELFCQTPLFFRYFGWISETMCATTVAIICDIFSVINGQLYDIWDKIVAFLLFWEREYVSITTSEGISIVFTKSGSWVRLPLCRAVGKTSTTCFCE